MYAPSTRTSWNPAGHPHPAAHLATDVLAAGVSLKTVQTLLGHASIATTKGYFTPVDSRLGVCDTSRTWSPPTVQVIPAPNGIEHLTVIAPEFDAQFEVGGNFPVQGSGTVRGRDLYFRARHSAWSFEVADRDGNMPSDGFQDSDGFHVERPYANACLMPHREAVAFIAQCLQQYIDAAAPRRPG